MTQTFDDIDSLVARLKAVARQHEQQPGSEPPPFAYRERLAELLEPQSHAAGVENPLHPALEELFAASLSDERFLCRAYRLLMGRGIDDGGFDHYMGQLPRAGRLYVLAELLCADEAHDYLARQGVVVPRRGLLTRPLRLMGRMGPLGKVLRPILRLAYRLVAMLLRPRLRLLERVRRLEVGAEQWAHRLRDVLLELDGELTRQGSELGRQSDELGRQSDELTRQGSELGRQSDELSRQSDELTHQGGELTRQSDELIRQDDEAQRQQASLVAQADELSRLFEHQQEQAHRQSSIWSALHHHRRAVERLVEAPPAEAAHPEQAEALQQQIFDAYYLAFEDSCRGSEAQVRSHLMNYRPQFEAARKAGTRALDLGCGRGEWLALLDEQGFEPHGVDLNVAMVEHCRERGLEVAHADILAALRQQPDDSHALISAFHIAEHLPFEALYAMVDEAQRVLAPGGVLILETPNPENLLVGSHTFYHDPTHRNPLTPTAMSFLLDYHGFGEVEVRRFNPYDESAKVPGDDPLTERVNGHLCGPQDFAVVGLKAAPAKQPEAQPEEHPEERLEEQPEAEQGADEERKASGYTGDDTPQAGEEKA